MLSTPNYSHFSSKDYEKFYEPSEDTFLLMDALEVDMKRLNALEPLVVVEIGSGSGLVINFLANHLANSRQALFFATDINENACRATRATAEHNSNQVDVINCAFLTPLMDRINGCVDLLVFNPPYVVTEADELGSTSLQAAWAGGQDGRQVMDKLFPHLDHLLSPKGLFYLVCLKQNKIDEIEELLMKMNFKMEIVLNRKAGIENLFILRFERTK